MAALMVVNRWQSDRDDCQLIIAGETKNLKAKIKRHLLHLLREQFSFWVDDSSGPTRVEQLLHQGHLVVMLKEEPGGGKTYYEVWSKPYVIDMELAEAFQRMQ